MTVVMIKVLKAENVVVGKVDSHSYAFVGLERVGGIMIYDITNPNEPYFVKYLYDPDNKDISPEGITFESVKKVLTANQC